MTMPSFGLQKALFALLLLASTLTFGQTLLTTVPVANYPQAIAVNPFTIPSTCSKSRRTR
jgi:hypothetical protein